jgi:hypothetical protein
MGIQNKAIDKEIWLFQQQDNKAIPKNIFK